MEPYKEWVETLREDVETLKKVVESSDVSREARKLAASALCYLVKRMDLVPDWEPSVGVLDDAMVIRILVNLAGQYEVDRGLDAATTVAVGRLMNEVEAVETFLGEELYAGLRRYCNRLADEAVRGRSPETIVDDEAARAALYQEIDEELRRLPAAPFADPEALKAKFKSYLHHKLK